MRNASIFETKFLVSETEFLSFTHADVEADLLRGFIIQDPSFKIQNPSLFNRKAIENPSFL